VTAPAFAILAALALLLALGRSAARVAREIEHEMREAEARVEDE